MSSGRIMVVEDEKDLRDVYALILQRHGYEVCVSTNGKEGLEQLEDCDPTLVLLDIYMPVLDGKGFLEAVDFAKFPDMKVVVCSNTSDNVLLNEMISLGADKVVTKSSLAPSDLTELVQPYMRTV